MSKDDTSKSAEERVGEMNMAAFADMARLYGGSENSEELFKAYTMGYCFGVDAMIRAVAGVAFK